LSLAHAAFPGLRKSSLSQTPKEDISAEAQHFFDWEYSDSAKARKRNLEGIEVFRKLLEPSLKVAKRYAGEKHIEIDWNDLTATRSKLAWIYSVARSIRFRPRRYE
jgi:hypothetical protein